MKRRTFVMSTLAPVALAACGGGGESGTDTALAADEGLETAQGRKPASGGAAAAEARRAMRRAAEFMSEEVAYKGGYVWTYLPDLSRSWGEMEARRTMLWVQPPGTPSMGHAYLDAYHATGDKLFLHAAEDVAKALMKAQHPSGGWNYIHDFAGEESLKEWYRTIGANGWRLEEFQHYYGNATFDDAGTAVASQFLLRMYVERGSGRYREAVHKAIRFVTESQYPVGGWPQRYPLRGNNYTEYVTFNDDVAGENIKFLLMCHLALGESRLLGHIHRAMESFLFMQQPDPQPGWALQHTLDGRPAAARTYEPLALTTHTTANNITQCMNFYALTGDPKYLARVPQAIDWLDKVKFTPELAQKFGRSHPTFVELGTDEPLYVHRRGSNVVNGAYYVDKNPDKTIGHYSASRSVNVAALRSRYQDLVARPVDDVTEGSPLKVRGRTALPVYFSLREVALEDLFVGRTMTTPAVTDATAQQVIAALAPPGYWPTRLTSTTNPYVGAGPSTPYLEDTYATTHVGDRYDTSPYNPENPPAGYPVVEAPLGISVETFIRNMGTLIAYVAPVKG